MISLMIIYNMVNIFSMKTYKSSRKLRVGVNWYQGMNWSTTTTVIYTFRYLSLNVQIIFGKQI